jgi:hypothetical protein
MGKKLTYEFVFGEFLKTGCVLLQTIYVNARTLMRYTCECGEESWITYGKFKRHQRCSNCGGTKKLTIEFVKKQFLKADCLLLETIYINSRSIMRYICKCGNKSEITYNSFNSGKRCRDCCGKKKLTIEFVKEQFLKGGCVLLETIYANANTLMKYICKCGNKTEITYDSFQQGYRCTLCKNKTERIVKDFLEENYSNIITQPKFEWCKDKRCLPFDFLLDDLKILIEVDGAQHFRQVSNWQSHEITAERDNYKAKAALEHGCSIIRVSQEDIFKNTIDWQEMINDAIKEYSQPTCVYISKDPALYNNHKKLMNST